MAADAQHPYPPDRRAETRTGAERRAETRLPEELTAVITDNAVASALFGSLPAEQRAREADWVASAGDRSGRAQRAVEVVRHALNHRRPQ
ncbi:MAG: hypothetical protein NVSMB17_07980 [Candidatus Dormibacteria bacterium]